MNGNDNLRELVHKAAAGDRAAFEELYRETCRSVYFTCLNILKDEQEAQDIAHDVKRFAAKDCRGHRVWIQHDR